MNQSVSSTEGLGPTPDDFRRKLFQRLQRLPAVAPPAILAFLRALPGRFRAALRALPTWPGRAFGALGRYGLRLNAEPALRFRTAVWSFAVIFAGLFILTGLNPFALLAPFAGYTPPLQDQRRLLVVYGAEAGTGRAVPAPRLLYLEGDLERDVKRLAAAAGQPLEITQKTGADYQELETLPEFHLAFRKVWFQNESGEGRLIIDLREESMDRALSRFLEGRSDANEDSPRYYQDAYFTALTASIFRMNPEIASVEYLIDGKREARPGMRFALDRRYLRGEIEPAALRDPDSNSEPAG